MEVSSNQASLPSEQELSGDMSRPRDECNADESDCCEAKRAGGRDGGAGQYLMCCAANSSRIDEAASCSQRPQRHSRSFRASLHVSSWKEAIITNTLIPTTTRSTPESLRIGADLSPSFHKLPQAFEGCRQNLLRASWRHKLRAKDECHAIILERACRCVQECRIFGM